MKPKIELIAEKKLVGKSMRMTLNENKTPILWKSFMPHRAEIENKKNNDLVSMQIYPKTESIGDMNQVFVKWAAVEVHSFQNIPQNMETYCMVGGLYAVFAYKGMSTDNSIFKHIFNIWLPNSNYTLDTRPHFEILGKKYKNADPESEEDIYIPIKPSTDTDSILE